ncbi:hypothetical protein R1sor_006147 [Riccia sorocarpa]|uniref:Tafazzin family protein n=1 Tax=Riccia sorocarpa TaxID=122646 RepID=A0ABD3HNV7_9MARC
MWQNPTRINSSFHEGVAKTSDIIGSSASRTCNVGGIQRRFVLSTVGACARLFTSVLSRTRVHNLQTLLDLVQSRPRDTPLVTVSNHMSTLDDPLMWGIKGLPMTNPKLSRWTLTAEDICFTNPLFSYFFRLGKCLPIRRGAGIYQPYMEDALDVINKGDWLHTFPEGKLSQEDGPMRRLKWGTASLIARASLQPIVLPIAHSGFEKILPENFMFGRRPFLPLPFKNITIVVGEPMVFDIPQLRRTAKAMTLTDAHRGSPNCKDKWNESVGKSFQDSNRVGFSSLSYDGATGGSAGGTTTASVEEKTMRWMYSHMSENLRCLLQELVVKAKQLNYVRV